MGSEIKGMNLPRREPHYRFAITPLADAMFQLLIFFMLSSNLTPYSFITLKTAPATSATPGTDAPDNQTARPPAPPPQGETAMWTLDSGSVMVGGQSFGFDTLGDLANALGSGGAPARLILVVRDSAQVQDVATVMEALEGANIASLQVASGSGG